MRNLHKREAERVHTQRFFCWATVLGYVLAQLLAVGGWAIVVLSAGWSELSPDEWFARYGVVVNTSTRDELREALFITALFTVPPALVYGVLDGVLRATAPSSPSVLFLRVAAPVGLVLLTLVWVLPNGLFWASSVHDIWGMRPFDPLMAHWLGGLAGMELALVAEFVVATVFWLIGRLCVRLYRRRRHG